MIRDYKNVSVKNNISKSKMDHALTALKKVSTKMGNVSVYSTTI